jgi:AcrR family transcriptional regulator
MAETMAEKGFAATTVAHVIHAAGVSRSTFYEHFSSKDDCFAKAFEAAAGILFDRATSTPAEESEAPIERFDRVLRAYLDGLADEPAFAHLFLVEIHAAGPDALAARMAMQKEIAKVVDALLGARTDADRFADEALIAAVAGLVTAKLVSGDPEGLRALHPSLVDVARRLHGI